MTPDIGTSLICGDALYAGQKDFTGLSLVDFAVVPHSDESPGQLAALWGFREVFAGTVFGVPDGAGILVEGKERQLVGPVTEI